jgi:mono/diheme cytochrome c family protein
LLLLFLVVPPLHAADPPAVVISEGRGFVQQDGPGLYRAICQGCHMEQGQGAQGAGAYPALAGNPRLASRVYVLDTLLNGRKSMPPVGRMLSDDQVAAVTNHVRSSLGNGYLDAVTAADIKALRPSNR